jgi:hypothetical protein
LRRVARYRSNAVIAELAADSLGEIAMKKKSLTVLALWLASTSALATEYTTQTTLTYVGRQNTRPIQPETDNHVFISFPASASWTVAGGSGGVACPQGIAVLPENDATMRAISLAAVTSGATVVISVDNTLPLVAAKCTVTSLFILAQ